MARIITTLNESVVKRNLENRIKSKIGETPSTRDSMVNILSSSIGDEIISAKRELTNIFNSNQLSNATGLALDNIAFNMYKLARRPATFAYSTERERNVYFYTSSGAFGLINNNLSIVIPAGTLISTEDAASSNTIVYRTIADKILNSGDNISYVEVEAMNVGSDYNVDSNNLVYHNFRAYADVDSQSLKVTNTFPIVNGADIESDESLRFRVSNYMQAQMNLNSDAILLRALELPGVLDIEVIPSYYGIGTTGVVMFGSGRENSRNLNSLFERRVSELRIPGQKIVVSEGIKVYFDFDIRVYVRAGMNEVEKIRARDNVKREIARLIKDKEFTKSISFSEISGLIRSQFRSSNIIGFGTSTNSNTIFENIFIRKTDRAGILPEEKEALLGSSYTVNRDERISFGIVNVIIEEQSLWVL